MKKGNGIQGFVVRLSILITKHASSSLDVNSLITQKWIVVQSKGDGVLVHIGNRAAKNLGLPRPHKWRGRYSDVLNRIAGSLENSRRS